MLELLGNISIAFDFYKEFDGQYFTTNNPDTGLAFKVRRCTLSKGGKIFPVKPQIYCHLLVRYDNTLYIGPE